MSNASLLLVAGLAAAALWLMAPTPATAAPVERCGNYGTPEGSEGEPPVFTRERIVGAGVYDIETRVARCRTARRMVRRFWNGRWGRCEPDCRRGSYRCRSRRLGEEVFRMRCTASRDRVVRFIHGA